MNLYRRSIVCGLAVVLSGVERPVLLAADSDAEHADRKRRVATRNLRWREQGLCAVADVQRCRFRFVYTTIAITRSAGRVVVAAYANEEEGGLDEFPRPSSIQRMDPEPLSRWLALIEADNNREPIYGVCESDPQRPWEDASQWPLEETT